MTAGMNLRVKIYRAKTLTDDASGGAQISHVLVYDNVQARLNELNTGLLAQIQGLENEARPQLQISPARLDVRINDEVQINPPIASGLTSLRYKVLDVAVGGITDGRAFKTLRLSRFETGRTLP